MKYLGQIVDNKDLVTKEYVDDASEVVQTLTSGTKIGSVGGTDLYAPSGGGGSAGPIIDWYGTSSTGYNTSAKVATVDSNFTLTEGVKVQIKFTNYNGVIGEISLNVNSTGAKSVYAYGSITSVSNPIVWTGTGNIIEFMYNGSNWIFVDNLSKGALRAFPIGSIYMSVNSTSPEILFGGSWTSIENRFLFSAGSFYAAGTEGGSRFLQAHTHSFTGGSHSHDAGSNQAFVRYNYGSVSTGVSERSVASGASGNYKAPVVNSANVDFSYLQNTSSETAGGTVGAVNTSGLSTGNAGNMPPFLTVYMWKRTA